MVTVLTETSATELQAGPGESHPSDELWLSSTDTAAITGWSMKPEGFCKDDICVPTPSGEADRFVQGDSINVSAFWDLLGKPAVRSADMIAKPMMNQGISFHQALVSVVDSLLRSEPYRMPTNGMKPRQKLMQKV